MYVISYDISSDKLRKKISDALMEYGVRVQYSVFECDIPKSRYRTLYTQLCALTAGMEDGSIKIYRLCDQCMRKTVTIGVREKEGCYAREDVIII